MVTLSEIISDANEIINAANSSFFFKKKCSIVALILKENVIKMNNNRLKEEENQEKLSKLKQILFKLSKKIKQIQDKTFFWEYIIEIKQNQEQNQEEKQEQKPIQQIINSINEQMKKISNILEELKIKDPAYLPSESLYDDYSQIEDFLADAQMKITERRKEVGDYLKQNQNIDHFESVEDENLNELNKNPEKKVNKGDFKQEPKICDSNSVFNYYKGTDKRDNKEVTILKLNKEHNHIFKRLLHVLLRIDHPYVESFIGSYIENHQVTIITDRKGIPLSDFFDRHTNRSTFSLRPGDRTIIAFKIAQAMAYLHSRRILHRNLIPSNIYIQHSGDPNVEIYPMIVGFRDSRFLEKGSSLSYTNRAIKTDEYYSFLAPEQFDNHTYDEKIDVFSFSRILFQFLTGSAPFVSIDPVESSKMIKAGERPTIEFDSPQNFSKEQADKLINLINSCWSQHPNDRPSFDLITEKMIEENIIFPDDIGNQAVIQEFYNRQKIKSSCVNECISLLNLIKQDIGQVFQYRYEFLRARPILHNYQYLLRESEYSSKETLDENDDEKMNKFKDDLENLYAVVSDSTEEKWNEKLHCAIYQNSNDLAKYMIDIYKSMNELGFVDIPKYEQSSSDLIFDYIEMENYFREKINISKHFKNRSINSDLFEGKLKEIDEYRCEKNLRDFSKQAFRDKIRELFSPFQKFEVKCEDYEIDERYHEGTNISDVFKARSKEGEFVAIKKVKEVYLEKGESQLVFLRREIGYLTKLNYKYIAQFIGYALPKNKNEVWLISKYYDDGSLHKKLHTVTIDPIKKIKIAFEIARAMQYLHLNRVLHLDLKSANVLMEGNTPKLIDFGFSSPDNDALKIKSNSIGTYNYMAPEILRKEKYDSKADVFSYGMLLWEIYSDESPFEDDNVSVVKQKILDGENLPYEKEINDKLRDLIEKCKNIDPNKRPTFDDILNEMVNTEISFGGDIEDVKKFYRSRKQHILRQRKNSRPYIQ